VLCWRMLASIKTSRLFVRPILVFIESHLRTFTTKAAIDTPSNMLNDSYMVITYIAIYSLSEILTHFGNNVKNKNHACELVQFGFMTHWHSFC
jgi:hypothetical protein